MKADRNPIPLTRSYAAEPVQLELEGPTGMVERFSPHYRNEFIPRLWKRTTGLRVNEKKPRPWEDRGS